MNLGSVLLDQLSKVLNISVGFSEKTDTQISSRKELIQEKLARQRSRFYAKQASRRMLRATLQHWSARAVTIQEDGESGS